MNYILQSLIGFFSLSLVFTMTLHGTQMDKAIVGALAPMPASSVGDPVDKVRPPDPHTHVERVAVKDKARTAQALPFTGRREEEDEFRQRRPINGHHPFDNYTLPMPS